MSRKKRLWRKVLSTLMVVLMLSGLFTPLGFAQTGDVEALQAGQEKGNIVGRLTQGGSPLSDITFSIQSISPDGSWYDMKSDANGDFQVSLPDGEFRLAGIWVQAEEKWYALDQQIEVAEGKLVGSLGWTIDLPTKTNVSGTLAKDGQALAGLPFSFRTTKEPYQWFDSTTNENGRFETFAADGEYQVVGIWVDSEKKWYQLDKVFTVAGSAELTIDIQSESSAKYELFGKVVKGTEPVSKVTFSIRTTGENPQWHNITTDEQGNYQVTLPTGEYVIEGIWVAAEEKWYPLNKEFTVDAAKEMNISLEVPPLKGVTGTLTKGNSL